MILKQSNGQKKLKKEFESLEKKNEMRCKTFRAHHKDLRNQTISQSDRVSKRINQFSSQNK